MISMVSFENVSSKSGAVSSGSEPCFGRRDNVESSEISAHCDLWVSPCVWNITSRLTLTVLFVGR